jgi:hypothetical protein
VGFSGLSHSNLLCLDAYPANSSAWVRVDQMPAYPGTVFLHELLLSSRFSFIFIGVIFSALIKPCLFLELENMLGGENRQVPSGQITNSFT